jgi:hypothetical protein
VSHSLAICAGRAALYQGSDPSASIYRSRQLALAPALALRGPVVADSGLGVKESDSSVEQLSAEPERVLVCTSTYWEPRFGPFGRR